MAKKSTGNNISMGYISFDNVYTGSTGWEEHKQEFRIPSSGLYKITISASAGLCRGQRQRGPRGNDATISMAVDGARQRYCQAGEDTGKPIHLHATWIIQLNKNQRVIFSNDKSETVCVTRERPLIVIVEYVK